MVRFLAKTRSRDTWSVTDGKKWRMDHLLIPKRKNGSFCETSWATSSTSTNSSLRNKPQGRSGIGTAFVMENFLDSRSKAGMTGYEDLTSLLLVSFLQTPHLLHFHPLEFRPMEESGFPDLPCSSLHRSWKARLIVTLLRT